MMKLGDLGHETNNLLDEVQEQNRVKDQITGIRDTLTEPDQSGRDIVTLVPERACHVV